MFIILGRTSNNNELGDAVLDALAAKGDAKLLQNVVVDCESSCFIAHAKDKASAVAIADAIANAAYSNGIDLVEARISSAEIHAGKEIETLGTILSMLGECAQSNDPAVREDAWHAVRKSLNGAYLKYSGN